MRPERQNTTSESGFTLVELLVGITIMLIVLAAGFTLLDIVVRSEPAVRAANSSIQDAQITAERMARELRLTSHVNSASANSLSVDTYLQQGSSCTASAATETARECRVVYTCGSTSCSRTVSEVNGSGAQTATFVTGLTTGDIFSYSPSTTAPTSISLTLRFAGDNGDDAITVTDGVALRNLGTVGS